MDDYICECCTEQGMGCARVRGGSACFSCQRQCHERRWSDPTVSRITFLRTDGDLHDEINAPSHYRSPGGLESVHVIEEFGLRENHYLACVVKYVLRHQRKGDPLKDLRKARAYLDREIRRLESER